MMVYIEDYTLGITQIVVVKRQASGALELIAGVLQGSRLGPNLFLIYKNALRKISDHL